MLPLKTVGLFAVGDRPVATCIVYDTGTIKKLHASLICGNFCNASYGHITCNKDLAGVSLRSWIVRSADVKMHDIKSSVHFKKLMKERRQ